METSDADAAAGENPQADEENVSSYIASVLQSVADIEAEVEAEWKKTRRKRSRINPN